MAAEINSQFAVDPELIRSGGGVFEIMIDDKLVFSKKAEDRFPENDEVFGLIKSRL